MIMNNIKAVIFDLDNTLADRKYAFYNHAVRMADMFMSDRSGDEKEHFVKRLIELDNNGYAVKKQVYDTIFSEFSPSGTADDMKREWNVSAELFCRTEDGAEDILKYLNGKYILALLTNGYTSTQNIKLDGTGLRGYFSEVMISEETGTAKPDKEIYLMMCRRIGVSPSEALYVGDHMENDVKGPLSAGLDAVLYDKTGYYGGAYPKTIASLSELKRYL